MSRKPRPTVVARGVGQRPDQLPSDEFPASAEAVSTQQEEMFRPRQRPSMALLTILDDGQESGETIRLRKASTTIGREECDICIPHDPLISATHLRITRENDHGRERWHLTDQDSRNGSFFRVRHFRLRSGFELMLGSFRYRLQLPVAARAEATEEPVGTRGWAAVTPDDLKQQSAQLIQSGAHGETDRFEITGETVIGSDSGQVDVPVDDPLLAARHVRLYEDGQGVWRAEDLGSRNGTWVRGEHSIVTKVCQFQLGEQRFLFKVL